MSASSSAACVFPDPVGPIKVTWSPGRHSCSRWSATFSHSAAGTTSRPRAINLVALERDDSGDTPVPIAHSPADHVPVQHDLVAVQHVQLAHRQVTLALELDGKANALPHLAGALRRLLPPVRTLVLVFELVLELEPGGRVQQADLDPLGDLLASAPPAGGVLGPARLVGGADRVEHVADRGRVVAACLEPGDLL